MGPGESATPKDLKNALYLGQLLAKNNFITLTGGRDYGVMRETLKGAKQENSLTIGTLPGNNKQEANPYVDIPIMTNMGQTRNIVV